MQEFEPPRNPQKERKVNRIFACLLADPKPDLLEAVYRAAGILSDDEDISNIKGNRNQLLQRVAAKITVDDEAFNNVADLVDLPSDDE